MVQIIKLDHLEYKEAILDSPEYREKLRKHEKHIADTSKNIKVLVKKFEDVINASEGKVSRIFNKLMCFQISLENLHVYRGCLDDETIVFKGI